MRCIAVITLLILFGCASKNKKLDSKDTNGVEFSSEIDKEFSWIENNDFVQPKEVRYIPENDYFNFGEDDVLSDESLGKVSPSKLEDVSEDSDDSLSRIASFCYRRRMDIARKIIERERKKYVKNPTFWNIVGNCYLFRGERKKAHLYYAKSIDLNGKYAPPINNIGVIHQVEGNPQKALLAYKKAASLNKLSMTPIFNQASLYLSYGHVSKAKPGFEALYRKNDDDVDVLAALGTIKLMEQNPVAALAFFKKIDDKYLSRADVSLNFALTMHYLNNKEEARELYQKVDTSRLGQNKLYYQRVGEIIR